MTAKELHAQAEMTRERGEFVEALKFTDEAMVAYQEEGNMAGFAEIQASRYLTLRHLFEKTGNKSYLVLAKHNAEAAVEIAEASGDLVALAMPYFNLAKALEGVESYKEAVDYYRKSVESMEKNPPSQHNRPAVIADFKGHMAVCEYKAGDKSAIERAEQAVQALATTDELKYNKDVWLSGAYIRMAEVLKTDDPEKAKEYLQKAKEIIDANPELSLRKQQWEKLSQNFA